jgi:predicted transcriptional regulator
LPHFNSIKNYLVENIIEITIKNNSVLLLYVTSAVKKKIPACAVKKTWAAAVSKENMGYCSHCSLQY